MKPMPSLTNLPRAFTWIIVLLLAAAPDLRAAVRVSRPAPGLRDGAQTLVVFSAERPAYSLNSELELLKLQLQRVTTRLETLPLSSVTSNQVVEADYLVMFHPQAGDFTAAATNLLPAFTARTNPSLWIGYGTEQLHGLPPFTNVLEPVLASGEAMTVADYRGRNWPLTGEFWIPVRLSPAAKVDMLIHGSGSSESIRRPLAWKSGHATFFSALPSSGPLGFLFSDLLLDFYGVSNAPTSRILLRIDDYQAASNHREFRRVVDYLHSRSRPFVLSIAPSWQDGSTGAVQDLSSAPDFVAGLRYAQQRGGRIVLRGLRRDAGDRAEFWDIEIDRPLASDPLLQERLNQSVQLLLKYGLLPLGWQTPQYSASRSDYATIARIFSTGVERVQLSDLTRLDQGLLSTLSADGFGRLIVPENLGHMPGSGTNAVATIRQRAELLLQLRGTVAACVMHAYQPFERWVALIETLEGLKAPFLDLGDLDHWVRTPGTLLLTGDSKRTVHIAPGPVTWKAFDRGGRLMAAEQETIGAAGERLFQRQGKGDYEIFEFTEAGR